MGKRIAKRSAGALAAVATMIAVTPFAGASAAGTSTSPSTNIDPYLVPVNSANTQIQSILSVNNDPASIGYPLAGIPDGLGAFADGGNITMVANHEIPSGQGLVRGTGVGQSGFAGYGQRGSFVSKLTINPTTMAVTAGSDLIESSADMDYSGGYTGEFSRFCSADLSGANELYNTSNGKGFNGRIFFAGEEAGANGRMVGHDVANRKAKVLTDLGQSSFENAVAANTATSDTVTVAENYDSGPGWNYVYVGEKKAQTGSLSNFDLAGLTGGNLYGVKVTGATQDMASMSSSATGASATYTGTNFRDAFGRNNAQAFSLVGLSAAGATAGSGATQGNVGATLQTDAKNKGAFLTDRTEDGAWDPSNPNDYYFVTTGSNPVGTGLTTTLADGRVLTQSGTGTTSNTRSRGGLWRMSFTDRTNPTLGGTLTLLVDGNESNPMYMPDNLTIDTHGHIVIQEDAGNIDYVGKVWAYDIASATLAQVAAFDTTQFGLPTVLKSTTASAAATSTATSLTVADASGVTAPALAKIGSEFVRITAVSGNTLTLTRGTAGSKAAIASGAAVKIFDPSSNPAFLTNDEESSGVIDAEASAGLAAGTFFFDAQIHSTNTPASPMNSVAAGKVGTIGSADADANSAAVENGQLLKMTIDFSSLFSSAPAPVVPESSVPFLLPVAGAMAAGGALVLMRRRRNVVA